MTASRTRRLILTALLFLCVIVAFARADQFESSRSKLGRKEVRLDDRHHGFVGAFGIRQESRTLVPWQFVRAVSRHGVELRFSIGVCDKKNPPAIDPKLWNGPARGDLSLDDCSGCAPRSIRPSDLARKGIRLSLGSKVTMLKLFDGFYSPPKLKWSSQGSAPFILLAGALR